MKLNSLYALVILTLLLSSCGGNAPTAVAPQATSPAKGTETSLPTNTPNPTSTPTITPIPGPQVVTSFNAPGLKLMKSAKFGHGLWEMVATSPDGKYFATAGTDGVIFYNADTLERIELFDVKDSTVAVAFSPDSSKIAVGMPGPIGTEKELEKRLAIEVWDVNTGKKLNRITGFTDYWEISALSFSGDGCLLFSYSKIIHNICDNSEFESSNGWQIKNEFEDQRTYFSQDGQLGLVHPNGGNWSVWDVKNNKKLKDLALKRPSFSPDSKRIMDLAEQRIFFYETSDFSKSLEIDTKAKIVLAKLSFDGAYAVSAENDGMLRLYDAITGEFKAETQSSNYLVVGLNFAPDGRFITMLDDRGYLKKVEIPTLSLMQEHTDWAVGGQLEMSPNGKNFAMKVNTFSYLSEGYDDRPGNLALVYDAETLEVVGQLGDQQPVGSGIGALAFSPDGQILAGASGEKGFIDLWDISTMQLIKKLEISKGKVYGGGKDPTGNLWGGVDFNTNGTLIVALNPIPGYAKTYIWDVATGELVANFKLPPPPAVKEVQGMRYLYSVAFAPTDDSKLIYGTLGSFDWKTNQWEQSAQSGNNQKYLWPTDPSGEIMVIHGTKGFENQFALVESADRNWAKFSNCMSNKVGCLFIGNLQGTNLSTEEFKFSPDGRTLYEIAGTKIFIWQVVQ